MPEQELNKQLSEHVLAASTPGASPGMKLLPISLPPNGAMSGPMSGAMSGAMSAIERIERMPFSLPFGPSDLLWPYPRLSFTSGNSTPPAISMQSAPVFDFKRHLPTSLALDPRIWNREDVATFLRWCEREFDLPNFDMDMFQMNGKALCLLTKTDLGERSPGAGDVLHNVLQMLVRDAQNLSRCLPTSPVTPTSRNHPQYPNAPHPLSPAHTHPPPNWNLLVRGTGGELHSSRGRERSGVHAGVAVGQSNSAILSPAPSVDSLSGQSGSPHHPLDNSYSVSAFPLLTGFGGSNGSSGSTQSDSEEDSYPDGAANGREQNGNGSTGSAGSTGSGSSPPSTPSYLVTNAPSLSNLPPLPHTPHTPHTPASPRSPAYKEPATPTATPSSANGHLSGGFRPSTGAREFFPDTPEPNTNGRLLWDFLQQLLNDANQRYTSYIAWKNRDTGVFKIVDPAGLAKLWGIQKNHLSMNYDKMSRALRYYYRVNILRKVQGERHCYQFLRNPTELKNIKNISLLRQQMSPTWPASTAASNSNGGNGGGSSGSSGAQSTTSPASLMIKVEPDLNMEELGVEESDDLPTDLSQRKQGESSSQSSTSQQGQDQAQSQSQARAQSPSHGAQTAATDLSNHSSEWGHFITPEVRLTSKFMSGSWENRDRDAEPERQGSPYSLTRKTDRDQEPERQGSPYSSTQAVSCKTEPAS